jgi:hypothetical protein
LAKSAEKPTFCHSFGQLLLKKIAAILFFSILFVNWFGYRMVIDFLQQQHDRELVANFDDEQYNEADLISVKVYYPLPYLVNSDKFERWDGEINIEGVLYKYVKRRFIHDSVEFLCLPDPKTMRLQTARDNFFRLANDLQHNQNKPDQPAIPSFKNLLNDYCEDMPGWDFKLDEVRITHHSFYIPFHTGFYGDGLIQPPDSFRLLC